MPSLMELVERVNKGDSVEPEQLQPYQESPNSAEKFLAHHAHAMLDLRQAHAHLLQSLEAIDYADQKVLGQFISISTFLGQGDLRSAATVKFGASAIARRDYALGLEAVHAGITADSAGAAAYLADRENALHVARQYARVAQSIGWTNPAPSEWTNKIARVAYVVSSLSDDDAATRAVRNFSQHTDAKQFKLHVYSTECAVRRDRQQYALPGAVASSSKRGVATIELLHKSKTPHTLIGTSGDCIAAAQELATSLVKDRIDVVIFDTQPGDPIAALVADWDVATVKINRVRSTPMYAAGITAVSYADALRCDADASYWSKLGVDCRCQLDGINADEDLGVAPARSAYGIPEQAVVFATAGQSLDRSMSSEFVDSVISLLRSHPHGVYLLIGEGDLSWQKRRFESAGVGKRVGYAGRRKDLPGFLRMADIYLGEFPAVTPAGVLHAMAVEKPVVLAGWIDTPEQRHAAAFAGDDAGRARDASAYVEQASKLARESVHRVKLGKSMRQRVESQFSCVQAVRALETMCEQLLASPEEETVRMESKAA